MHIIMNTFLSILGLIFLITYIYYIFKIRYRNENTLKNNIITESVGAMLMLTGLVSSIINGSLILSILFGVVFLIDIFMVIYYVKTKETLR